MVAVYSCELSICLFPCAMKSVRRKTEFYNVFIQSALGCCNALQGSRSSIQISWVAEVCEVVDTHQIRALFNSSETSFGKMPFMAFTASAKQCWKQDLMLKWSRQLCGCCEYIALVEGESKQLFCFEKNYGKGISTHISVWASTAAEKLLIDRFFLCLPL